jgi:hypothetical protein
MNEQIIDTVDHDALVTVEVPGSLFIRLNQLLSSGLTKDNNELLASVNRVKANETDKQNTLDYHVETVLLMNGLISNAAVKQKKLKPYIIKKADSSTKTD